MHFRVIERARGLVEAQSLTHHELITPHEPNPTEQHLTELTLARAGHDNLLPGVVEQRRDAISRHTQMLTLEIGKLRPLRPCGSCWSGCARESHLPVRTQELHYERQLVLAGSFIISQS